MFLESQIAGLEPFDFLVASAAEDPDDAVEIYRDEGGFLHAAVVPRPPDAALTPEQVAACQGLGFRDDAGVLTMPSLLPDAAAAAELLERALTEVFDVKDSKGLDVHHGSRKDEHEAELKLAALRTRLEPLLTELLGTKPPQDEDGDYVFEYESSQVFVAPRGIPGAPVVVRIFAITNVGVNVTPELGLLLSRLNFHLMFGRFGLDTDHAAIWFSETLLGDITTDEELRFTIRMVAETAAEWDERIAEMFGGFTHATLEHAEPEDDGPTRSKPGEGGYL
jgi:hypothetical protein